MVPTAWIADRMETGLDWFSDREANEPSISNSYGKNTVDIDIDIDFVWKEHCRYRHQFRMDRALSISISTSISYGKNAVDIDIDIDFVRSISSRRPSNFAAFGAP